MPLLSWRTGPFTLPDGITDFTSEDLEGYLRAANETLAALVPNAHFRVASESRHGIHPAQPELEIEATQQVLEGVRSPATWYSLNLLLRGLGAAGCWRAGHS